MIELVGVRKVYNGGRPNEFTAVDTVSAVIRAGCITVLKGASGSGKTTLLGIIGCMARPTSGRVIVMGREVTSLPERFLTIVRRQTFGFIFQRLNLIKGMSALENVMLPALPTGEPRAGIERRALAMLRAHGLSEKAASRIELLSGGEAQRVAICRALINNPRAIIADEPTAHLDSKLSAGFMDALRRLKGEGKTVIIASHDPIVYDSPHVDDRIEMRDGMASRSDAVGVS